MKRLLVVILVAAFSMSNVNGQNVARRHTNAFKLFDANSTFDRSDVLELEVFRRTSLLISFQPGDTAVLSSTRNGRGPIVIDNFLTVNGATACDGVVGQAFQDSCFGPIINPAFPIGVPIETVLSTVGPIDVTHLIPVGTNTVVFELLDHGVIAGNTDLWLVTTGTVSPDPGTPLPPLTITLDASNTRVVNPVNGVILRDVVTHSGQAALQLTYEPDRERRLFDLSSIEVLRGSLNIEVESEDGTIGVYRDVSTGLSTLAPGDLINQVLLQCPTGEFCVSSAALRRKFSVQSLGIHLCVPKTRCNRQPPDQHTCHHAARRS